jgi:hypothetical protein
VEDRILGCEDKIDIKEKTEELLGKRFKSCERNMQELSDYIKKPNLRMMGIKEGEEVQANEICNIFNKIIQKISQILRKSCPFRYRKPVGHK